MIVPLQVSPSSKFQEDLGLDSLDSVEVGAGLQTVTMLPFAAEQSLDVKQTAHLVCIS